MSEVARLQAQVHQLQQQCEQHRQQISQKDGEIKRLFENNRNGDIELRRANEALARSREANAVQQAIEERDQFQEQSRALQELLRQNASELESLRQALDAATQLNSEQNGGKAGATEELQTRITELSKRLESREGDNEGTSLSEEERSRLQQELDSAREELRQKEAEDEEDKGEASPGDHASKMKALRAHDFAQREARLERERLQGEIAEKAREIAEKQERIDLLEEAHARDLENFMGKLREKDDALIQLEEEKAAARKEATQAEAARREKEEEANSLSTELRSAKDRLSTLESELASAKASAPSKEEARRQEASQSVIQQLTEAAAEAEAAKKEAEEELEVARSKVISREKKVARLTSERAESEARAATAEEQLAETTTSLKECEQMLEQVRREKDGLEERVGAAEREATEAQAARAEAEEATRAARMAEEEAVSRRERAEKEIQDWRAESDRLRKEVDRLELQVAEKDRAMRDLKERHRADTRKSKQLVRDLQPQLAKEVENVRRLEREKRDLERHLGELRVQPRASPRGGMLPRQAGSSHARATPPSPARASVRTSPSRSAGRQEESVSSSSPVAGLLQRFKSKKSNSNSPAPSSSSSSGGPDDMLQLLNGRLEQALQKKEEMRVRVKFLEGVVQDLTKELNEKKAIVAQLTRSSSREGPDQGDEAELPAGAQEAIAGALRAPDPVATMQSLLHQTMVENSRLRRDLRILGEAMTRVQSETSERRSETDLTSRTEHEESVEGGSVSGDEGSAREPHQEDETEAEAEG